MKMCPSRIPSGADGATKLGMNQLAELWQDSAARSGTPGTRSSGGTLCLGRRGKAGNDGLPIPWPARAAPASKCHATPAPPTCQQPGAASWLPRKAAPELSDHINET